METTSYSTGTGNKRIRQQDFLFYDSKLIKKLTAGHGSQFFLCAHHIAWCRSFIIREFRNSPGSKCLAFPHVHQWLFFEMQFRARQSRLFLAFTNCSASAKASGLTVKLLPGVHHFLKRFSQFHFAFTTQNGAAGGGIQASARCAGRIKTKNFGGHQMAWCRFFKLWAFRNSSGSERLAFSYVHQWLRFETQFRG